jgi:hypothetical protein
VPDGIDHPSVSDLVVGRLEGRVIAVWHLLYLGDPAPLPWADKDD